MGNELQEVVDAINEQTEAMKIDMAKSTNKAAARRARIASSSLTKLYKQYRKLSLK